MIIHQVELETVCGPTSVLPENKLPALAFAGRSNVGKSSLINVLMNRKSLARTSSKPGKTATINFYRVDASFPVPENGTAEGKEKEAVSYYLVDLPGYGYAKRSKEESARWGPMVERYLAGAGTLAAIFLLVDVRLPAQDSDRVMLNYARHYGIPCVVVATKADKLKKNALAKQTSLLKEAFALTQEEAFIPFSSVTRTGLEELARAMGTVLLARPEGACQKNRPRGPVARGPWPVARGPWPIEGGSHENNTE